MFDLLTFDDSQIKSAANGSVKEREPCPSTPSFIDLTLLHFADVAVDEDDLPVFVLVHLP
jgi:hypothetical protein